MTASQIKKIVQDYIKENFELKVLLKDIILQGHHLDSEGATYYAFRADCYGNVDGENILVNSFFVNAYDDNSGGIGKICGGLAYEYRPDSKGFDAQQCYNIAVAKLSEEDKKDIYTVREMIDGIDVNMRTLCIALLNIMENKSYKVMGYATYEDFCAYYFKIGKSTAYKYAAIGSRFGVLGNDGRYFFDNRYAGFNISALGAMVNLTDDAILQLGITPETSVRDILKLAKKALTDKYAEDTEDASAEEASAEDTEDASAEEASAEDTIKLKAYFSGVFVSIEQLLSNKDTLDKLIKAHGSTLVCFYDNSNN